MCLIDWSLLGEVLAALGTLVIGIGTLAIGYGAIKSIPRELRKRSKEDVDPDAMRSYRMLVMRLIAQVEVENMGLAGRTAFPENFGRFLPRLLEKYPELGSIDDIKKMINDLMKDGRIQYSTRLENNTPVLRTIYWDEFGKRKIEQIALTEEGEPLK